MIITTKVTYSRHGFVVRMFFVKLFPKLLPLMIKNYKKQVTKQVYNNIIMIKENAPDKYIKPSSCISRI